MHSIKSINYLRSFISPVIFVFILFLFCLELSAGKRLQKEMLYLEGQIENYSNQIKADINFLNKFESQIESIQENYRNELHRSKFIMDQFLFFAGSTYYRGPYEYRLLSNGFLELIEYTKKDYHELKNIYSIHEKYLTGYKQQYQALNLLIENMNESSHISKNNDSIEEQFLRVKNRFENQLNQLKPLMEDYRIFLAKLNELYLHESQTQSLKRLQTYYFSKNSILYNANFFENLYSNFPYFVRTTYNNIFLFLPTGYIDYILLLLLLLFFRGVVYKVVQKLLSKLKVFQDRNIKRQLSYTLGWFFIGTALSTYCYYYEFPHDIVAYHLSVLFYVKAVIEAIILIDSHHGSKKQILSTLLRTFYYLFILVIIFQILQIQPCFIILLWPLGILSILYILHRKFHSDNLTFRTKYFIFYLFFFLFLIILTLLNYVYLSLFLFIAVFIIHIAIILGLSITRIIKEKIILIPFCNENHMLLIIAKGILVPTTWLIVIFYLFYWISYQLLTPKFFYQLLKADADIQGFHIYFYIIIILIFILFLLISMKKTINIALDDFVKDGTIDIGFSSSFKSLLTYLFCFVYIILALSLLKVNILGILIACSSLGIGIGFGLKDITNNFICGLILVATKLVRPGDIIEVSNLYGTVKKVNIRNTIIISPKGDLLSIPNSEIINNELTNYKNIVRNLVTVSVKYGTDAAKVRKLLNEVAEANNHIIWHVVRFSSIGEKSMDFLVAFKVDSMNNIYQSKDELTEAIYNKFKTEGIEVFYPELDVHQKTTPDKLNLKP